MKSIKTYSILIALIAFIASAIPYNKVSAQVQASVSFDVFYNELSPYGQWDRDPSYGDIWFPRAEANFRPYGTNGYWTMTEYGNTWVSEYDWGWAPFHYGRWVYTNYRGWGWIPGYEWGPAWVDWRSGGGYYGWAPMAPSVGVSVSIGALPLNLWVFLPTRRIYDRYIHRHWSYGQRNIYNRTTIINNTYIVNNNRYYGGPARRDIERNIGRRVEVRNIRIADHPGRTQVDKRSVSLYRPGRSSGTTRNTGTRAVSNSRSNSVRSTDRKAQTVRQAPGNTRSNSIRSQQATRPTTRTTQSQRTQQPTRPTTRSAQPQRTQPKATHPTQRRQAPSRSQSPARSQNSGRIIQQASQRNSTPGSSAPRSSTPRAQRSSSPSAQRSSAPSVQRSSGAATRGNSHTTRGHR